MKPPVETIRLGKQSRDQLTKIKRFTGIENWNIICRWAFLVSIREPTLPPTEKTSLEDGVEISWKVFAGSQGDIFSSLIANQAQRQPDVASNFHAHLRRGLGYLASSKGQEIHGFMAKWLEMNSVKS